MFNQKKVMASAIAVLTSCVLAPCTYAMDDENVNRSGAYTQPSTPNAAETVDKRVAQMSRANIIGLVDNQPKIRFLYTPGKPEMTYADFVDELSKQFRDKDPERFAQKVISEIWFLGRVVNEKTLPQYAPRFALERSGLTVILKDK